MSAFGDFEDRLGLFDARRGLPGVAAGEILLVCDAYRSRQRNIDAVRDRLAALVRQHLHPPRQRRKTRPTRGSKERRLKSKKQRSSVKKGRGRVSRED